MMAIPKLANGRQIHLRTDPDNAPAKPHECGETMQATLYDIPPDGQYEPGAICERCIDVRREKNRRAGGFGAFK